MDTGSQLEHDLRATNISDSHRGELDIVVAEVGDLLVLILGRAVLPDVQASLWTVVREVVEHVLVPHRDGVRAFPVRDLA